jgi:hypothetical protein
MSKFVKSEITTGEYAMYNGKFLARFKRGSRNAFLTFLCKNFTVEEYFERLDAGVPPLTILESKGYIDPKLGKLLKTIGFAPTVEGKAQYLMSITSKTKVA